MATQLRGRYRCSGSMLDAGTHHWLCFYSTSKLTPFVVARHYQVSHATRGRLKGSRADKRYACLFYLHHISADLYDQSDIFDLSSHASDSDSSFADALRGKLGATKEMLTTIVQRGSPALLQDQVFLKAQAAQAEVCAGVQTVSVCVSGLSPALRSVRPCGPKWQSFVPGSSVQKRRKRDFTTTSLRPRSGWIVQGHRPLLR
jgi:hypothetical protein